MSNNPTPTKAVYEMTPDQLREFAREVLHADKSVQAEVDRSRLLSPVEYFTANQGAVILGVSVETFRRYVRDGRIKARDSSETERFHIKELQKFVERNGTKRTVANDSQNS